MGWLRDILLGPEIQGGHGSKKRADDDEQDWRVEEQRRWADRPLDDWSTKEDESKMPGETDPYRDASGNKIRPVVEIDRLKVNVSSDEKHLEVWAYVRNHSEFDLEVTRVNCLGQHMAGCFLKAGASREIRIFSGNTPTSEAYRDASVQYKIVGSGDYFEAKHYVSYSYEQSEHGAYYLPEEFTLNQQIKDI